MNRLKEKQIFSETFLKMQPSSLIHNYQTIQNIINELQKLVIDVYDPFIDLGLKTSLKRFSFYQSAIEQALKIRQERIHETNQENFEAV